MATPGKKKTRPRRKASTKAAKKPAAENSTQSGEKQDKTSEAAGGKASGKGASKKKAKKKASRAAARKKSARKSVSRRTPARKKAALRKAAAAGQTIHCTLALTGGQSMVLPTSAIAEITDYAPPAPLDEAPEWLLGQVEWEDWQVPVISYGSLIDGETPETATGRSRIMVVKSLSNSTRVPFIGVLVSEIPKLAKLSEADLEVTSEEEESPSVHCAVKLAGKAAVIPDLDRLSQMVGHAAYGTVNKEGTVAQA